MNTEDYLNSASEIFVVSSIGDSKTAIISVKSFLKLK